MDPITTQLKIKLTESISALDKYATQARRPSKWSIQQIVEHLILTYCATEEVLTTRLAKGRPTSATPSLFQQCAQVLILRAGYFPSGRPAPDAVIPKADSRPLSGNRLAGQAEDHLVRMDALLDEAVKMFGPRDQSVSHVVLGPLSPAQWRRFHLVHGLHHIRQIKATAQPRAS